MARNVRSALPESQKSGFPLNLQYKFQKTLPKDKNCPEYERHSQNQPRNICTKIQTLMCCTGAAYIYGVVWYPKVQMYSRVLFTFVPFSSVETGLPSLTTFITLLYTILGCIHTKELCVASSSQNTNLSSHSFGKMAICGSLYRLALSISQIYRNF